MVSLWLHEHSAGAVLNLHTRYNANLPMEAMDKPFSIAASIGCHPWASSKSPMHVVPC